MRRSTLINLNGSQTVPPNDHRLSETSQFTAQGRADSGAISAVVDLISPQRTVGRPCSGSVQTALGHTQLTVKGVRGWDTSLGTKGLGRQVHPYPPHCVKIMNSWSYGLTSSKATWHGTV
jgi:hypothetical protein